MLEAEVVVVFFTASVLLGLAPGPDNLFVLTQSALQGRAAGLLVTAGLCTGLLVHTAAVAVGIAALIRGSPIAFNLLKAAGAAYLLYLAWQVFRASGSAVRQGGGERLQSRRLYTRGIIMNVTNPKVSIFFLAFLPQFVQADGGPVVLQIAQLGLLFIAATIIVFGAVSLLAGTFGQWLNRSETARKILNWTAGCVFLGLAARLAISSH